MKQFYLYYLLIKLLRKYIYFPTRIIIIVMTMFLLGVIVSLPASAAGPISEKELKAKLINNNELITIQAVAPIIIYPTLTPGAGGCSSYWYSFNDGYNSWLTLNATTLGQSTNSGVWQPNFPYTGLWKVEAYIASHNYLYNCGLLYNWDTSQAKYVITSATGNSTVTKSQRNIWSAWISLGTYQFNAGTGGYVKLKDLTGESYLSRNVSFSVMRFTFVGTSSISGKITDTSSTPISGVSVSNGFVTVTTNASGIYSFTGLASNTYTLTPSKIGYTSFSPVTRLVTVPSDAINQDFVGIIAPTAITLKDFGAVPYSKTGFEIITVLTIIGTLLLLLQLKKFGVLN